MRVLVSAASRHQATWEMAQWIAAGLSDRGMLVTLQKPARVVKLEGFDAFVVGSAVYVGRWMEEARILVDRIGTDHGPVWLFSSGGLGDPPLPDNDPADVAAMVLACGAVEHRSFAGRLERSGLNLAERAVVKMVKAPEGDFRNKDEVTEWAHGIADALIATPEPAFDTAPA